MRTNRPQTSEPATGPRVDVKRITEDLPPPPVIPAAGDEALKGDCVEVVSGLYKGKAGKVIRIDRREHGVIAAYDVELSDPGDPLLGFRLITIKPEHVRLCTPDGNQVFSATPSREPVYAREMDRVNIVAGTHAGKTGYVVGHANAAGGAMKSYSVRIEPEDGKGLEYEVKVAAADIELRLNPNSAETSLPSVPTAGRNGVHPPAPAAIVGKPIDARVDSIQPDPHNARQHFDAAKLDELADSIRKHGVRQRIELRRATRKSSAGILYELVSGERRLRAAQLAGLEEIPATLVDVDDVTAAQLSLIENLQREDLNPIEIARGYQRLADAGRTQSQIAQDVGRSASVVANTLRLLRLPEDVQDLIGTGKLRQAHGTALCSYVSERNPNAPALIHALAARAVKESWPSSKLEARPHEEWCFRTADLVAHLEHGWGFDHREACKDCPFDAYRRGGYCLNPPHAEELKRQAREAAAEALRQQEVDRMRQELERERQAASPEARVPSPESEASEAPTPSPSPVHPFTPSSPSSPTLPRLSALPTGEYTRLDTQPPPPGCDETCPCRRLALNVEDQPVPICMDTERFSSLRTAERTIQNAARQAELAAARADLESRLNPQNTGALLLALSLQSERPWGVDLFLQECRRWGVQPVQEGERILIGKTFAAHGDAIVVACLAASLELWNAFDQARNYNYSDARAYVELFLERSIPVQPPTPDPNQITMPLDADAEPGDAKRQAIAGVVADLEQQMYREETPETASGVMCASCGSRPATDGPYCSDCAPPSTDADDEAADGTGTDGQAKHFIRPPLSYFLKHGALQRTFCGMAVASCPRDEIPAVTPIEIDGLLYVVTQFASSNGDAYIRAVGGYQVLPAAEWRGSSIHYPVHGSDGLYAYTGVQVQHGDDLYVLTRPVQFVPENAPYA